MPTETPAKTPAVNIETRPASSTTVGGRIEISQDVIAQLAAYALRDVPGLHAVGRKGLFDALRRRRTPGVQAEIGEIEAAFDLDVVLEYGADVRAVASEARRRICAAVERMAGRDVVEINIKVVDIHLPAAFYKKPA